MTNSKQVQAAVEYIDSWLELNFANATIPSLSVAIQSGNKTVYKQALGYSNVAKKIPATPDTKYRIASHSKMFTATALMQLQLDGKLKFDDTVSKHLTWFTSSNDERIAKLTIRQLLNQTTGLIRDGEDADYWQQTNPFPDEVELKDYIQTAELFYKPDEIFKYSNFGFSYLGLLIEAVTGSSYSDYVTTNILKPLHLTNTGADTDGNIAELAMPYGMRLNGKPRHEGTHSLTNAMAAATGFYSTAEDVCRFLAAHFYGNNILFDDKTKREFDKGQWKVGQSSLKYGLGFVVWRQQNGWNWRGHSGGFPGFTSCSTFEVKKKLAVSVLINARTGLPEPIMYGIMNILETFLEAKPAKSDKLAKFTGRFYNPWEVVDIIQVGDSLKCIRPLDWVTFNKATKELSVVDENTLWIKRANGLSAPGELIHYTFDEAGNIASVRAAGASIFTEAQAKQKGWL